MRSIKLFILIFFLYVSNIFSSEINIQNAEKLVSKTEELTQSLREKLKDKSNDLLTLADMLRTYTQGGKEAWIKNIINFSKEMKEYPAIRLLDNRGKEIIKVINSIPDGDLKDESVREYFKITSKSKVGQVYLSPVIISEISKKPIIRLATLIVNLGDVSKAVLEFDWDFEEIINKINNNKITASGQFYIISSDGLYLTNPDRNKIMSENINKINAAGFDAIFKKMRTNQNGWGEYIYNNQEFVIGYNPFQEMGWIILAIIPRNELIDNFDTISELTKQYQEESAPDEINTISMENTAGNNISSTTQKLMDGSLRTKAIDSYRATFLFTTKKSDGNNFTFKIKIIAKDPTKSDYILFFQQNQDKIVNLNLMDETIYRKIKYELISPALLQKSKIINQNLVMFYLPLKNEVIRMDRNQLSEYESLFNETDKKYLKLFSKMEFKQFTQDRFDIKIDEQGTIYTIEMKLKKPILTENELIKKVKLWIRGDYFFPIKYEWLNEKDEIIVSLIYDNMEINASIEDNEFIFNPSGEITVKEYDEIRSALVNTNKTVKSKDEDSTNFIHMTYKEINTVLENEISEWVKMTAEGIALSSLDFIETANYDKLFNHINIALKNKNIMYVMILSQNGERVLFKSSPAFSGLNLTNPDYLKIKEFSHPILLGNRLAGTVRIGVSEFKFVKDKSDSTKILEKK